MAAAFTAINSVSQAGRNIVVTVNGSTTEPIGGAVLNQNTFGVWTTLNIYTTGTYTINGPNTGDLVQLSGADNVSKTAIHTVTTYANTIGGALSLLPGILFVLVLMAGLFYYFVFNCNLSSLS